MRDHSQIFMSCSTSDREPDSVDTVWILQGVQALIPFTNTLDDQMVAVKGECVLSAADQLSSPHKEDRSSRIRPVCKRDLQQLRWQQNVKILSME